MIQTIKLQQAASVSIRDSAAGNAVLCIALGGQQISVTMDEFQLGMLMTCGEQIGDVLARRREKYEAKAGVAA